MVCSLRIASLKFSYSSMQPRRSQSADSVVTSFPDYNELMVEQENLYAGRTDE